MQEPTLTDSGLLWRDAATHSLDEDVLRPAASPFAADGGLRVLRGNLGRAVIKVSAVPDARRVVSAPARVFHSQDDFLATYRTGNLDRDFVAVLRGQGPAANGMPELHSLSPALGSLQDRGFQVALVTDGRLSGASGKFPAAIHVTPEAAAGGAIAKVRDGDLITIDSLTGELHVDLAADELAARDVGAHVLAPDEWVGTGRELFANMRRTVSSADAGASTFLPAGATSGGAA
jgi:phosphogluconate dehydratase